MARFAAEDIWGGSTMFCSILTSLIALGSAKSGWRISKWASQDLSSSDGILPITQDVITIISHLEHLAFDHGNGPGNRTLRWTASPISVSLGCLWLSMCWLLHLLGWDPSKQLIWLWPLGSCYYCGCLHEKLPTPHTHTCRDWRHQ